MQAGLLTWTSSWALPATMRTQVRVTYRPLLNSQCFVYRNGMLARNLGEGTSRCTASRCPREAAPTLANNRALPTWVSLPNSGPAWMGQGSPYGQQTPWVTNSYPGYLQGNNPPCRAACHQTALDGERVSLRPATTLGHQCLHRPTTGPTTGPARTPTTKQGGPAPARCAADRGRGMAGGPLGFLLSLAPFTLPCQDLIFVNVGLVISSLVNQVGIPVRLLMRLHLGQDRRPICLKILLLLGPERRLVGLIARVAPGQD